MKLERWKTKDRWYWHMKATNGRIVGASEQGYRSKWWCGVKAKRAYTGVPLSDVEGP